MAFEQQPSRAWSWVGRVCGLLLKLTCEKWLKSLISKRFKPHPKNLWTTLVITCLGCPRGLENQGFGWNAHKKSNFKNLYESMTYERYGICSGVWNLAMQHQGALPFFVHKSSPRKIFFLLEWPDSGLDMCYARSGCGTWLAPRQAHVQPAFRHHPGVSFQARSRRDTSCTACTSADT